MKKSHILREIRRTAQENAGVPLGRRRLQSKTGIAQTNCYGKYRRSWIDAVREAGYTPIGCKRASVIL